MKIESTQAALRDQIQNLHSELVDWLSMAAASSKATQENKIENEEKGSTPGINGLDSVHQQFEVAPAENGKGPNGRRS